MKLKLICKNQKLKAYLDEFFKDFYIKDEFKAELVLDNIETDYELKLTFQNEIIFTKNNHILDNNFVDLNVYLLEIKNILNNPDYLEYFYFPTVKNRLAGLPEYGYDRKRSNNFKREVYGFINETVICFQFENKFLYENGNECTAVDVFFFDNIVKLRIGNFISESYVIFDISAYSENDLCSNPELEDLILMKLDSLVDRGMLKIKKRV